MKISAKESTMEKCWNAQLKALRVTEEEQVATKASIAVFRSYFASPVTWESGVQTTTPATRSFYERTKNPVRLTVHGKSANGKLVLIIVNGENGNDVLKTSPIKSVEIAENGYAVFRTQNSSFSFWNEAWGKHSEAQSKADVANGYLRKIQEFYEFLKKQESPLITDVVQKGFEAYEIQVSDPNRYHEIVECECALQDVCSALKDWEHAHREDEWKEIRLHNRGVYFSSAYKTVLRLSCKEAINIRKMIEEINCELSIVLELPTANTELYWWH